MIKLLELFSGYGGASFALKRIGIEHKCIGYSDIEKCANYVYSLNHGENVKRLGNVMQIDPNELEDFDLLTAGFPCQSFSIAGNREGFKAKNKGNLFFEIIRIAQVKKPRFMLLENVQGILNHDEGRTLKVILNELSNIGYYVVYDLLYSKEYGTPQNRPRVWFMCFRDKIDREKFMFPEPIKLKVFVKDLLEEKVDKKYYLTEKQLEQIMENERHRKESGINETSCSTLFDINWKEFTKRVLVYDTAHTTARGKRFKIDGVSFTLDTSTKTSLCIADYRSDEGLRIRLNNICPTLNARNRQDISGAPIIKKKRWRRLTPRECFRLMGFFNDEIKFGNLSDSKLYFLAGNGWDINVASKILYQLFNGNQNKQQLL